MRKPDLNVCNHFIFVCHHQLILVISQQYLAYLPTLLLCVQMPVIGLGPFNPPYTKNNRTLFNHRNLCLSLISQGSASPKRKMRLQNFRRAAGCRSSPDVMSLLHHWAQVALARRNIVMVGLFYSFCSSRLTKIVL